MLAAPWQGDLIDALDAVVEDGIPDRKSPGSKRRRYRRSGNDMIVRKLLFFSKKWTLRSIGWSY
jgi:hypothetical protein